MANVNIGQAIISKIRLQEGSAADTPPSGYFYIYTKTDGKIYGKDDGGTEYDLTGTVSGGDATAIHDNVASEISAITAKGSPTSADFLLIEDAADSNNKKRITLGDLPAAGGSDSDAIHDNVAAEISAVTAKGSPTTSDYLLIEDAADSNNKKSITIGNLPTINGIDGTAIHDNVASEISAVTNKANPTDADYLLIEDAAATNAKKHITIANLFEGSNPDFVRLEEQASDPSTPASGYGAIYAKTDNSLYYIGDDGIVRPGGVAEGARVYNNANISVPNNAFTALTFNSEDYDTNSLHSTSVNTDRLTCQVAGKYLIGGAIRFASNATGRRGFLIELNGVTAHLLYYRTAVSSTIELQGEVVVSLAVSDYVTLKAFQDSGGALNVNYGAGAFPYFWMHRIG